MHYGWEDPHQKWDAREPGRSGCTEWGVTSRSRLYICPGRLWGWLVRFKRFGCFFLSLGVWPAGNGTD